MEATQVVRPDSADRQKPAGQGLRKVTALLEVLGIYVAGQLLAFIVASVLGIPLQNPLITLSPDASGAELLALTGQLLAVLLLQYGGWFVLIFAIGWWRQRSGPARYGLTLAGKPLVEWMILGAVLFAVAAFPLKLLDLLNSLFPLGESVAWREALYQLDWGQWQFWLLMAVGSFGLVPVLEEMFYRGYFQTRIEEEFGATTAIVAVSTLFTLSHSQYFVLNALNIGTLLAILISALALGFIYFRTRSLVAPVLAHALLNIPMRGAAQWAMLAAMLVVIVLARRQILAYLRDFLDLLRQLESGWHFALAVAALGLFAIAFVLLGDIALLAGLAFFVIALVLIAIDKRRSRNHQKAQASQGVPG